jgi:hypothetical protein
MSRSRSAAPGVLPLDLVEPPHAHDLDDVARLGRSLGRLAEVRRRGKAARGDQLTGPEDWADPDYLGLVLCLIHAEVSSALDAVRRADRPGFARALAGVVVRTAGLAVGLGEDLAPECFARAVADGKRLPSVPELQE